MDTKEYIETGILELYVYGLLSESENEEVNQMSKNHSEIEAEIVSIEKAIVNLSTSFSPFLSAENFEKIKEKLDLKYAKVIPINAQTTRLNWLGWAAAVVLFVCLGFQYTKLNETKKQMVSVENEKKILAKDLVNLKEKNNDVVTALSVVRDSKNSIIELGGQAVSPKSFAKIYWNKQTQKVYVDATGLPKPPKGMVYQIWSLKLAPQLTPTSIGLLSEFDANSEKIFAVENTGNAEAFGITLEPNGGSKSPTMEQLYALGKV